MTTDTTTTFDNAVLVRVSLSRLGLTRKVDSRLVSAGDADVDYLRVDKKILKCDEYAAIVTKHGEIKKDIRGRCLPLRGLFNGGVYAIGADLVESTDRRFEEHLAELEPLVERFVAVYPQQCIDVQARLNGLYDVRDYPSVERVRRSFGFAWQYLALSVPGTLSTISPRLARREFDRFRRQLQTAGEEMNQALVAMFKEIVDHMRERLTPDETGRPKIFRDTLVTNFTDFLETFSSRNSIVNNEQLAELVTQTRELLRGVSPDTLRNSRNIRESIADGVQQIAQRLDGMIITRPTRDFSFDDEEDVA